MDLLDEHGWLERIITGEPKKNSKKNKS